ncbi:beta-1,4-glucuronosyltransferase WelK [Alteraurantiacibacter aquimixticola]|uniref:Exopolysaccharide biosynthesis protein n=1 Tax=Alteraurantiacibacter aquimixticola TaxID=2489173 RepID=A0A4T3EWP1_9SPHN|nr:glycosyltransferase [Alteraurantiacibacter aquimixticola]TIX48985.1 exopolysaccharide biosynthesis protein [Alteraurantiacibacter aquimixticola]
MTREGRPVICLAASGGGHVRQILDLAPLWDEYPHFLVTEATALGRSLSEKFDTSFVPHFALGQAKLGAPFLMLGRALSSLWTSLRIVLKRRPDIVITTGAGSQVFILFWARLLGARIILIDSFARFDAPSAFARMAGFLAHHRFAQSEGSARSWNGAVAFDPLKHIDTPAPEKEDLLLATVGATLPFARLVDYVAAAKEAGHIPERVLLQVGEDGEGGEGIDGVETVKELSFDAIRQSLTKAKLVVCHGGTGSIITALQQHCRVIVIPRQFALGEHYDNHQVEIAEAFAARGLILVAHDQESFAEALEKARNHRPQAVTTDYSEMIAALRPIVESVVPRRSGTALTG